jgi:hypothetical protein
MFLFMLLHAKVISTLVVSYHNHKKHIQLVIKKKKQSHLRK